MVIRGMVYYCYTNITQLSEYENVRKNKKGKPF